ncbi:MAG: flagellar hook-basal body complex protein FliE [Lachnospiraceae bacterium]|nr:flagellar hook-basal body complex protein FliE [Lachnospiraceae bacterium]
MDLSAISGITSLGNNTNINSVTDLTKTGLLSDGLISEKAKTEGTMFDSFLDSAINNIQTTNAYLSDYENEEIKWALGETENTHDLTIALQKASTALQYTVAIRDKVLEAYQTIMNMQI